MTMDYWLLTPNGLSWCVLLSCHHEINRSSLSDTFVYRLTTVLVYHPVTNCSYCRYRRKVDSTAWRKKCVGWRGMCQTPTAETDRSEENPFVRVGCWFILQLVFHSCSVLEPTEQSRSNNGILESSCQMWWSVNRVTWEGGVSGRYVWGSGGVGGAYGVDAPLWKNRKTSSCKVAVLNSQKIFRLRRARESRHRCHSLF